MWRFLLLLLLSAAAIPARAEVRVESTHPRLGPLQNAAAELGAQSWGNEYHSEKLTHVLVELTRSEATVTFAVSPDIAMARETGWLEEMAHSWGAGKSERALNLQPRATFLRFRPRLGVAPAGLSRSAVALDLPALVAQLRSLTLNPVVVCIRLPGADTRLASPPAPVRGTYEGDTYLFFPPGQLPSGRLELRYGVPDRWPLALGAMLLLWVLAPVVVTLALLRVCQREDGPDEERLERYKRRQKTLRYAVCGVALVSAWLLHLEHLRYWGLVPARSSFPSLLLVFPLWAWYGVVSGAAEGRVEKSESLPGPLRLSLAMHLVFLIFILGLAWGILFLQGRGGPLAMLEFLPLLFGGFVALMSVVMLATVIPITGRVLRRKPQLEIPQLPEDPEQLRALLREMTEKAAEEQAHPPKPVPDPRMAARVEQFRRLAQELTPEQTAALALAARATSGAHRGKLAGMMAGLLAMLAMLLALGVGTVLVPAPRRLIWHASCLLLTLVAWGIGTLISRAAAARGPLREAEVDYRIATLMEDPRVYVEALRLHAAAMGEMFPESRGPYDPVKDLEVRRRRLEERLGIG